jgi:poly(A) polymerase
MTKNIPLFKEAHALCKVLLRNGYDAHIVNAPLQKKLVIAGKTQEIDIATDCDRATLSKIIPNLEPGKSRHILGQVKENGLIFNFCATEAATAAHPERALLRMTPRLTEILRQNEEPLPHKTQDHALTDLWEEFRDPAKTGAIQIKGLPLLALQRDYLLAIRALRLAANHNLPVEPNTWMTIVQAGIRVLDYVPTRAIMDEWRQVSARAMAKFVRLLHEAHILHGLVPELAALSCVEEKVDDGNRTDNILNHTITCMQHYAAGEFEDDWLGVLAVLFQDVGKLHTGEFIDGAFTFYQHHRVGAGVTRKILRRLHFSDEDIDEVCHLVRHHLYFHFMLTDRGMRRFSAAGETKRLMAMCLADIKAGGGNYTNYNHNCKYLERADQAEIMVEPLLNGNAIMEHTKLPPGPMIGMIREALLKAQIAGDVPDYESAVAFVRQYEHI